MGMTGIHSQLSDHSTNTEEPYPAMVSCHREFFPRNRTPAVEFQFTRLSTGHRGLRCRTLAVKVLELIIVPDQSSGCNSGNACQSPFSLVLSVIRVSEDWIRILRTRVAVSANGFEHNEEA